MNSEIVIKITSQGVSQSGAITSNQESGIPVPDPGMGESLQNVAKSVDAVPSPADNLDMSGESTKSAPSPEEDGLSALNTATGGLPEPVSLGEIEKLGSSAASLSGDTKPPEPTE